MRMATSAIVSSASTTVNAERGRRATSILSAVRTLANDEADAFDEGDDRPEVARKFCSDELKTARSDRASAFPLETSRFVERLADDTRVTDDAFDWAVGPIDLEVDVFGAVVGAGREPSTVPAATSRSWSGVNRAGSRWKSATAKKQTISTLRTMLGPTWRFMAVFAQGWLLGCFTRFRNLRDRLKQPAT
jgi:hypothetical protein